MKPRCVYLQSEVRYLAPFLSFIFKPKQRSKLDRQRERHCQREIDHMGTMARAMRPLLNRHSFKEKLHTTQQFSRKLRDICEDAQHSLPDVFLWMLAAGRRVAYHRIPARQIIYSPIDEQRGPLCHRRQTILLKVRLEYRFVDV